ncbi:hypothetical protein [Maricaulis sp.]|uniref:hypothetical protein n=1 Tax=Maricaulis sp. TaxID=1486257 RepID=UPI003A8E7E5E
MYRNSLRGALLVSSALLALTGAAHAQTVNCFDNGDIRNCFGSGTPAPDLFLHDAGPDLNLFLWDNWERVSLSPLFSVTNYGSIGSPTDSSGGFFSGLGIGSDAPAYLSFLTNAGDIYSTISQNGAVIVDSEITLGAFTNSGSVTNAGSSGTGVELRGLVTGDILNSGAITGGRYGFEVLGGLDGVFTNSGTITSTAAPSSYDSYRPTGLLFEGADSAGSLVNTGTIDGSTDGIRTNLVSLGGFTNSGVVRGQSGYGAILTLTGDFVNEVGGVIEGGSTAVILLAGGGDFINHGTITGDIDEDGYGGGVEIDVLAGDFLNTGTISGGGDGVWIIGTGIAGGFENTGTIHGDTDENGYGWGVYLEASEAMGRDTTGAAFNNSGVIRGGYVGVGLLTNLQGDFVNSGTIYGSYPNSATGLYANAQLDGDLTNSGTIGGTQVGLFVGWSGSVTGDLVNSGNIFSASGTDSGVGLSVAGTLGGDFENTGSGYIYGRQLGIRMDDMRGARFTNSGLILSGGGGVNVLFASSGFTFRNAGTISSVDDAVTIRGGAVLPPEGAVLADDPATGLAFSFINTGDIDSSEGFGVTIGNRYSYAPEAQAGGPSSAYAPTITTVDFTNQGLISSGDGPAVYFAQDVEVSSFNNSGLIYALGEGHGLDPSFFAQDYGVQAVGVVTGDFTNTGEIVGARMGVNAGEIDGDFINQGLIAAVGGEGIASNAVRIATLGGDFFNDEDGVILGGSDAIVIDRLDGEGFYNAGLIEADGGGVIINALADGASFINTGDILVGETGGGVWIGGAGAMGADGLAQAPGPHSIPAVPGGIIFGNSGTIAGGELGVILDADVLQFDNSGTIDGSWAGLSLNRAGDFTNSGDIIGGLLGVVGMDLSGDFINEGLIEAVRGYGGVGDDWPLYDDGYAVQLDRLSGDFINLGAIRGASFVAGIGSLEGSFVNEGLLETTNDTTSNAIYIASLGREPDAPLAGSFAQGGLPDSVFVNYEDGRIISVGDGVYINNMAGAGFLNYGLISAAADGVRLSNGYSDYVFLNLGDILAETGAGIFLGRPVGPLAEPLGPVGSIVPAGIEVEFGNAGNIIAGRTAVEINETVASFNNIGTITGTGTAVQFGADVSSIYNSGTITALLEEGDETGAGIEASGSADVTLENDEDGVISGFTGVNLGAGDDLLVNAGTLTGAGGVAAALGDGDDVFAAYGTGTITGTVDGGAGDDRFAAYGTQTLDMVIENFEEIWAYEGDISLGRDYAAELMLSRGDSLDLVDFTFTGALVSFADLHSDGGMVDGDVFNFGSILGLDTTITGDLYNGGVVNPGGTGTIGTLTVLGDYIALNAGDSVTLPGDGAGISPESAAFIAPSSSTMVFNFHGLDHDQVIVSGAATLGGDLLITGDLSAAMAARQAFTLFSAASVTGGVNLLNSGGVLFTPTLNMVGSNVLLSFTQNSFASALAPATLNQSQAALGLEDRWNLGASAADDVILALNAGAASAPILEAFAPETSAALTRQSARIGTSLAQTVANCAIGPNAGACGQRTSDGGVMIWTNVSGSGAALSGDGNAAGVDETFSQVSSGAEYTFGDQFAGGIFLASGTGDVDVANGVRGHGEIDSVAGGIYARMQAGRFTLAGLAGYVDTDIEARRHTPFGTSIGETGGSVSFARLDARLTLVSGVSQAGFAMSGTYAYAEIGNYAQRGADGFDLDIVGDSFRVEDWELRGFFDHSFEPSQSGLLWSFGGTAGVVHANGEDTASVAASFPGGTAPYEAFGPRSNDTGGVASGYIDLTSPLVGVSAQIGVEGRWMDGEDSSRVYGRFAWRF